MRWRSAKRAIERCDLLGYRPARRGGRVAATFARVRTWQRRRWLALLPGAIPPCP
jgi:hypothetical protein